ncbi:aminotransferase class I/II-fold pyridoxal phosphate-dependent enzyme [Desulfovibrio aerotolerans]|uniref:Aminotransferase n=1 Tax=Solidesulfovibrio aerotolerans TaxID=295255 RepID=A0A7C9IV81_9BACT|nr:pyridoxal phosphate-dependent aminotransferase [Solidesulfovibrio aerotolerans]MYL82362.1 aminotransferase class I/II-fold pyridoxal phosphate-dependent enzyme [Solidesulfovibrio aerotolerans]
MNPACKDITSFLVMDILERAQAIEAAGHRVIHLEIGEPDFDMPECVKEAARKAVTDGHTHYTHSLGLLALRQAICDLHAREYGVSITPDRVLVTGGTSPAMLLAFGAMAVPGEHILLTDPAYACYPNFLRFTGLAPRYVPVAEEDGFQWTPQRLRECVTDRTAGILLNSPANPTGTLLTPAAIEAACATGKTVISDEIYHGLTYGEPARCALEFSDEALILNGFSKRFAMTGLRLGYLIAPAAMMPLLQKLQQNLFICASSVSQWAGLAALTPDGLAAAEAMRQVYDERRRALLAGLTKLGLAPRTEPTGAFYVFVRADHLHPNSLALAYDILEKAHVGVTPGIDFGPGGEGHLRFSYANSLENIEEGLERLGRYMAAHCG